MRDTRLILIRHGQAVINVQPILGGPKGDTGLTPLGIQQTTRLRDRLAETGEIQADVLLASTLPRARQTAEILQPALNLPIVFDDDLQELRVGPEADGLTLDEYKKRFGWIDFEAEPFTPVDPGGESWATFMLRVGTVLNKIIRAHPGRTIVAVTHGGVVDGSFLHFFGLDAHRLPRTRFHTLNTSLTHWVEEYHQEKRLWRLARYNDDAHLFGLESGETMHWQKVTPVAAAATPEIEQPQVPLEQVPLEEESAS